MTCNRNSLSKQLLKVVFVCVCVLSLPMVLDFTNIAQLDRWFKGCVDRWWETSFFFFFYFVKAKVLAQGFMVICNLSSPFYFKMDLKSENETATHYGCNVHHHLHKGMIARWCVTSSHKSAIIYY